jgi:CRP/FNR family transcriptional regulator
MLHNGSADCVGLFVICSGQLRAFVLSDEGKEVTIYRLFERDICLFSASCMIQSIQFEVMIEAEKDSQVWVIPPDIYKELMESSAAVANYTNQLMATRFSEVMWLIEQIMWKSFDKRLAAFLLEESALEESDILKITHEKIASHLGTAREVVTRMLRYFQSEGMVNLTRGAVELSSPERLMALSE